VPKKHWLFSDGLLSGRKGKESVSLSISIYHRFVTLAEQAIRGQMQCLSVSLVLSLGHSLSVSVCQRVAGCSCSPCFLWA